MQKSKETCPAKKLLQLLGRPHVLTIIHAITGGSQGFNQLQQITHINSRTLTLRLQMLLVEKIVISVDCPKDARCRYYELTLKGKKIDKILTQLDSI